jgi:Ca2+-binding EF-hand superfamily protein
VSQLLSSDEKKVLFETFKALDKNNDGVIESVELAEALRKRKDISEERLKFLIRVIDTNCSGHIDYTEFLVAGLNPKMSLTEQHFEQAFQYFDMDHSGAITFE